MVTKIYNPGALVALTLDGEAVRIGHKETVYFEPSLAKLLHELNPGLEMTDVDAAPEMPKPPVEADKPKDVKKLKKKDEKHGKK